MTFDKLVTCHWFFIFSSFWGKLRNYKMIFATRILFFWFSDLLVQEPICNARRKTNWDQLWKSFSLILGLFIYILKFHHTVRDILLYQSFSTSRPYRYFQVEQRSAGIVVNSLSHFHVLTFSSDVKSTDIFSISWKLFHILMCFLVPL